MTHPHQLAAVAALWSLRAATRYLAAVREAAAIPRPGRPAPTQQRARSWRQLAAHNELLRAERADRVARTGLSPIGQGAPAPISPALLDLDRGIGQALTDATWLLADAHRTHPLLAWSIDWHTVVHGVFGVRRDARWTYLSVTLPATPPTTAALVARQLTDADRRIRASLGLGPDWYPLASRTRCPACGERQLRVQASAPSPAWHTVVCVNVRCRCDGDACTCTMPVRAPGVRHIWWLADAPAGATVSTASRGSAA